MAMRLAGMHAVTDGTSVASIVRDLVDWAKHQLKITGRVDPVSMGGKSEDEMEPETCCDFGWKER